MAYVDLAYYSGTYFGEDAGSDFNKLAARASDDVDLATMNSIVVEELTEKQLELVKKATCAQIEYRVINGEEYNESVQGGAESIGSYSRSRAATEKSPMALSPRALAYLEQTGLLFRGVSLLPDEDSDE